MPQAYQPPTRRLPTNRRPFEHVVRDLRHTVYSVIRIRPTANGQFNAAPPLGSGFFVSPEIFLSAGHVLNHPSAPHADGDIYQLVRSDPPAAVAHTIQNVRLNDQLHVFPELDLGLLRAPGLDRQPYVALDYADWLVGKEIGVAGYPVARIRADNNGQLAYDGLIFRVAKGVATSAYNTNIQIDGGHVLPNIPVLEVNFLFVPGNSGGPVFDAETGRVAGFVHGYSSTKIRERVEQVGPPLLQNLPAGLNPAYVENLNAIYSLAIRVSHCRDRLEQFHVNL